MSGVSPVLEVVEQLEALAGSGAAAGEVVVEAGNAVARWWWDGRGDRRGDRVVMMAAELARWCAVAAREHEAGCERLARSGRVHEAAEEGRRSRAFRAASRAVGGLVGL